MNFPVYFDFDGTLVDTLPGLVEAVNDLRSKHGLWAAPASSVETWIGDGLDALLSAALDGAAVSDAIRDSFVDFYTGRPLLESRPYAGIAELLDELNDLDLPLAIVTNKNQRSVDLLLNRLGWRDRFAAVVCPQDGLKKPDRRFMKLAADRLGLPLGPGLFVGDSEFDVAAAVNAGVAAVAVTWGYRPLAVLQAAKPHFLVGDVTGLRSLIVSRLALPL